MSCFSSPWPKDLANHRPVSPEPLPEGHAPVNLGSTSQQQTQDHLGNCLWPHTELVKKNAKGQSLVPLALRNWPIQGQFTPWRLCANCHSSMWSVQLSSWCTKQWPEDFKNISCKNLIDTSSYLFMTYLQSWKSLSGPKWYVFPNCNMYSSVVKHCVVICFIPSTH